MKSCSANGAAREIGVSHTTVLRWYRAGRCPDATRDGRTIRVAWRDIHGPRALALKPVRPTSEDPTLRRPYRALVSAIILQALKDLHNPALRTEARAWMDSPLCHHLMMEALGIDRKELPAVIGRPRTGKPGLTCGAQTEQPLAEAS